MRKNLRQRYSNLGTGFAREIRTLVEFRLNRGRQEETEQDCVADRCGIAQDAALDQFWQVQLVASDGHAGLASTGPDNPGQCPRIGRRLRLTVLSQQMRSR